MKVTVEMIEELQKRKNISYAVAKEALENSNGDLLEALIYIEDNEYGQNEKKENKTNNSNHSDHKQLFMDFLKQNLVLQKNNIDQISLPLWLFLILLSVAHEIIIISLIIAVFTKHKIYISKNDS